MPVTEHMDPSRPPSLDVYSLKLGLAPIQREYVCYCLSAALRAICDSSAHSYVHCTYTADATEVGHLHPSGVHLPRPVENHHRVHLFS